MVAGLLVVAARGVAAQSAAQRDSLDAFRDSLDRVTDSTVVARMESDLIAIARIQRDTAMHHLRLGLIALRLGALGRRNANDDAAGEFQWAGELQPQWPWAWYGLGLSEYAILDSELSLVAGIQAMFGQDRLTRAARMFARAAEVDPTFVRALTELTSTTLAQRVNLRLAVALVALRRAAETPAGRDPRVLLARGRVEREVGDLDSSAVAFRDYIARGGDSSLGRFELSRTLLGAGHLEGVADYYAAAGAGDPTVDSMVRSDLVDLVGDTALQSLDSLQGIARGGWLRDFWAARDEADLHRSGERLAEHYRRVEYAHRNFRLVSPRRLYGIEERYRSYNRDYDDRGLIYIRHGEPTERASAVGHDLPPNQSWRYERPEGDLVFHFVARQDVQDYKLVESIYDILGFNTAVSLRTGIADTGMKSAALSLLQTREKFAPIYGRLIAAGATPSTGLMDQERRMGRKSIATGTTSDSYVLQFDTTLADARWSTLAAGSDSSGSFVHLVWALPERSLHAASSPRGSVFPVRVRYALLDLATGKVAAAIDTTANFLSPNGIPRGEWLLGRVPLRVPAGRYVGRVSIEEGGAGMVTSPDTVLVASPTGLGLSDLVLGSARSGLHWVRTPEDTVLFNPVGTYRSDTPLHLYYEVFGIPAGTTFRTEVRVTRPHKLGPLSTLFGGGGTGISLKSDNVGTGAREEREIEIDLSRLKPGVYTLEVTLDRSGQRVRRRTAFQVVKAPSP